MTWLEDLFGASGERELATFVDGEDEDTGLQRGWCLRKGIGLRCGD